jgi:thiol-disulfide isomerase/thioredoxin
VSRGGRCLAAALLVVMVASFAASAAGAAAAAALDASQFSRALQERRGAVVLVNFWATWCRACLKEIPALMDLEHRYRDQGLVLMYVSLDDPADYAGVVAPFLDKWFPGLPTYRRASPDLGDLVNVLDPAWNEVLPTSYVVDRDGRLRARIQGGQRVEEFIAAIRPWLDAPAAPVAGAAP